MIITDQNIDRLYGSHFANFNKIVIGTGEKIKTQTTVEYIIEELLNKGCDRHTFIVGVGGGVVCDIAGFVASVFMRGIPFGFVSTTLLSQVDASIGGKNGINFKGFKNLIGVFNHPLFVICDINMLKTLPIEELKSGLVEVIKHSIINQPKGFDFIVKNLDDILSIDISTIQKLLMDSIQVKMDIVAKDEKESGERKKLNLGHTIGHAIESTERIPHGFAIAKGLIMTAKLSQQAGFCNEETVRRISSLIKSIDLPTTTDVSTQQLIGFIQKDKKKNLGKIDFIMIKKIGEVFIKTLTLKELENKINNIF